MTSSAPTTEQQASSSEYRENSDQQPSSMLPNAASQDDLIPENDSFQKNWSALYKAAAQISSSVFFNLRKCLQQCSPHQQPETDDSGYISIDELRPLLHTCEVELHPSPIL